jgi:hypothetical protein
MPAPRRALKCIHCDTVLREKSAKVNYRSKSGVELIAIAAVICSCISFVLSFGITGMYQEGGLLWGLGSLTLAVITINWVRKLEQRRQNT